MLLLVWELRLGQTHGTSLAAVLALAARRQDCQIQWKVPGNPVICQLPKDCSQPLRTRPAGAGSLNKAIKVIALTADILTKILTHAIRRGAMRDIAHLTQALPGVSEKSAGVARATLVLLPPRALHRTLLVTSRQISSPCGPAPGSTISWGRSCSRTPSFSPRSGVARTLMSAWIIKDSIKSTPSYTTLLPMTCAFPKGT